MRITTPSSLLRTIAGLSPGLASKPAAKPSSAQSDGALPPTGGPVHSVATLVALSAVPRGEEQRRELVRRAADGLDRLERLQRRWLAAGQGGSLSALEDWLKEREPSDDPALDALLDEMELRVRLELAKSDQRW